MQDNYIKKLYPMTKLSISFLFIVATLLVNEIISKAVIFALLVVIAFLSGEGKTFIGRVVKSVLILFLILFFVQTFFYPQGRVLFEFWIFKAKYEGLIHALNLGLVILNVGGSIIWFFVVTKERDFIISLQKAGLSSNASYVILSTLQMIPALKKKSAVIMNAQKARGVETEGGLLIRAKAFVPSIIPLVLSSINGIEERALTLEARGFLSKEKPTFLYDVQKTANDRMIMIIVGCLFVVLISWRIMSWLI